MTGETEQRGPVVRVSRIMPARREKVFDAWLDADGMRAWMCPGDIQAATAEIDAQVGGKFRIVMHGADGDYEMTGEYLEIERPSRLVFTWFSRPIAEGSQVTLEFLDRGDETELVLTHVRLPTDELAAQHKEGWGHILGKLATRITT